MRRSRATNTFCPHLVTLMFGAAVCLYASTFAAPALAAPPSPETFIQILFGDLPDTDGADANGDGAPTVADILLIESGVSPTGTPTPTATPTLTATLTSIPSETPTKTPTPTPIGLLFAGAVAELVPHGVGDKLVYRITDPLSKVTTETTTVISVNMQGGFMVDDKITSGQTLQLRQTQSYTDTGSQLLFNGFTDVFFMPATITTCTPPLLRLTSPLIAGQMFFTSVECDVKFADSGVEIGFVNRTDTFTPKEIVDSVTVPAGTFTSVVHISGTTNQSGALETDEIYVAPGVGPILQLASFSGQVYRHELVSGTIGGHPVGQ